MKMLISQEICLILFFKMKVLKIFAVFANLNSNSFALLKKKKNTNFYTGAFWKDSKPCFVQKWDLV